MSHQPPRPTPAQEAGLLLSVALVLIVVGDLAQVAWLVGRAW